MYVIVLKYVQLFCVTLFFNSLNCDQLLLHNDREDRELYATAACVAKCLNNNNNTQSLQSCYRYCVENETQFQRSGAELHRQQVPADMDLVCRGSNKIVIQMRHPKQMTQQTLIKAAQQENDTNLTLPSNITRQNTVENEQSNYQSLPYFMYLIKVQESANPFGERIIFLSNESLITLENEHIQANRTYNVSATIITSNQEFIFVKQTQLYTLPLYHKAENVTKINVSQYTISKNNSTLVDARMNWEPASDQLCFYDIFYHRNTPEHSEAVDPFDYKIININKPQQLYNLVLKSLMFGASYSIAVRGLNMVNHTRDGDFYWHQIQVPSCSRMYKNNLTICPPDPVKNLEFNITVENAKNQTYFVSATWDAPDVSPDLYLVVVEDNPDGDKLEFYLPGNSTEFSEIIYLQGAHVKIDVVAKSKGGWSLAETRLESLKSQPMYQNVPEPLNVRIIFVLVSILLALVMSSIGCVYVVCRQKIKLREKEERDRYFRNLDQNAPLDPAAITTTFIKNLSILEKEFENLRQDPLEVNLTDVQFNEKLGEGAFGIVHRGVIRGRCGTKHEVAIKSLKEFPSHEEIKAFLQEIILMKLVGRHPNIVGLIGHHSENIERVMLFTEYCGKGNLLDFLRKIQLYMLEDPSAKTNYSQHINSMSASYVEGNNLKSSAPPTNSSQFYTASRSLYFSRPKSLSFSTHDRTSQQWSFESEIVSKGVVVSIPNLTVNIMYEDMKNNPKQQPSNPDQCQLVDEKNLIKTDTIEIQYSECLGNEEEEEEDANSQKDEGFVENLGYDLIEKQQKVMKVTSLTLLEFAQQVSAGMEYLADKKVIHRDLAARNVLVCDDLTLKIADFGLSRDVYREKENVYLKKTMGKLPIKWLALESLTRCTYTTQSDVWSYGILLYEIFTLGQLPYPTIPTDTLLGYLKSGYRMEKPENCSDQLYELMLNCWKENPIERPSFTKIKMDLEVFINDMLAKKQLHVQLSPKINHGSNKINGGNFCVRQKPQSSDESYLKPII